MKRPAFQFYPSDWRNDTALQLCSITARGIWHEMLCVMHECVPYGHLAINGEVMPDLAIARLIGVTVTEYRRGIAELERSSVFSRTDTGIIYSRRMVRDEQLRVTRANGGQLGAEFGVLGREAGIKGGRPKLVTGDKKPPLPHPLKPPPSSSSSSSLKPKPIRPDEPDGFVLFWTAYPKHRRHARGKCLALWRRDRLETLSTEIVGHVAAMAATEAWRTGYDPAPLRYLGERRWEDGVPGDGGVVGQRSERVAL